MNNNSGPAFKKEGTLSLTICSAGKGGNGGGGGEVSSPLGRWIGDIGNGELDAGSTARKTENLTTNTRVRKGSIREGWGKRRK